MRRDFLLIAAVSLLAFSLPAGCGSGTGSGVSDPRFGVDAYRPNYGGDLLGAYYWEGATITYRVIDPTKAPATDIYTNPIVAAVPTTGQAESIRGGFAKWQAALGNRRSIVEVPSTDAGAGIDVMVQPQSQFSEGAVTEQYGRTDAYFSHGVEAGVYGRAVIRLRNDLPERVFRYTALHEIGHGLGLAGHSRKLGDVMYPVSLPVTPPVELSARDRNTIAADFEGR